MRKTFSLIASATCVGAMLAGPAFAQQRAPCPSVYADNSARNPAPGKGAPGTFDSLGTSSVNGASADPANKGSLEKADNTDCQPSKN